MRRHLETGLLVVAALTAFSACEKVDYIELKPSDIEFKQPNNQVFVEAKCMARTGARAIKAQVSWSVADPSIAEVNQKGLVKPVAHGRTELIARYGDVEARAPINVVFVDRITVDPKEMTLQYGGDNGAPKVRVFTKDGKELTDRTVTMVSRDKKVAEVVGKGGIMPLDPGVTTIDVQVEGARASIQVTVEKDPKRK